MNLPAPNHKLPFAAPVVHAEDLPGGWLILKHPRQCVSREARKVTYLTCKAVWGAIVLQMAVLTSCLAGLAADQSDRSVPPSGVFGPALLFALGAVESGNRDHALGKSGEVSRYQVLPSVWREAGGKDPTVRAEADRVVTSVVIRRVNRFVSIHRRSPTPQELYLLWHRPAWCYSGKRTQTINLRCERFAALYRTKL